MVDLVRKAGSRTMQYWPGTFKSRGREGLHIVTKPDGSYVTEADLVSNEILIEGFRALFPDHGILSEEGPHELARDFQNKLWIIDPLDGTQTFIDGNDDFAILSALCCNQELEFGVMYLPARDQLGVAALGRGSKLNGQPMCVSSYSEIQPQRLYLRHIKGMQHSPLVFPHWLDSSMAFLRVCCGELDGIVVRIKSHQEWDLATAAILISESGGKVSDERGAPLVFGGGEIQFKYFVGSNGRVHDQLISMIGAS